MVVDGQIEEKQKTSHKTWGFKFLHMNNNVFL